MSAPLPPLRDDLVAVPDPDGEGVLLHDPIAGRWHRIGPRPLAMLREWDAGDRATVLRLSGASEGELDRLVAHLAANGLLADHGERPVPPARHPLGRLLHGYLFVRIPLVDPTRLLDRLVPLVRPLLRRRWLWALLVLGAVGLALASRHAAEIERQWRGALDPAGAAWLIGSFVVSKLVHELGHAIVARRMGARVPTLGIAFMVLWPVLYTDTTDAWRLSARRRLLIDAGGVLAEGALAVLALWAWIVLPDGGARHAALVLATVGLAGSLLVNLNPFMRFDGYHMLADAWRMPNLQPRAFALARWRMREALLGLGEPPPEALPRGKRRLVILYAWATWLYRLVLFVGIALLVYHIAFKALGILLFTVEIAWFILRPLRDEAREWWRRRERIAQGRRLAWSLAGAGAALVLLVPWSGTVVAPAILVPDTTAIHAPEAGVLEWMAPPGTALPPGEIVVRLRSPELDADLTERGARTAVRRAHLHRASVDPGAIGHWRVAVDRLAAAEDAERTNGARTETLWVRASHAGIVHHTASPARPGEWIERGRTLAHVVGGIARVHAYVPEAAWPRVRRGAVARFVPDRLDRPARVLPAGTVTGGGRVLAHPLLAARHGGPLSLVAEPEGERLRASHVRIAFEAGEAPPRALAGTVHLPARRESIARRVARRLAAVAIREAGL